MPSARYLFGRDRERAALKVLLDAALSGSGGGIVLNGQPGIGKTALLGYAIEARQDFRVARGVGVESEMEIAFAALQQLCSPFLELTDRLPHPQRAALEVAFGLGAGRHRIHSWSDWRSSASSRRPLRSSLSCA